MNNRFRRDTYATSSKMLLILLLLLSHLSVVVSGDNGVWENRGGYAMFDMQNDAAGNLQNSAKQALKEKMRNDISGGEMKNIFTSFKQTARSHVRVNIPSKDYQRAIRAKIAEFDVPSEHFLAIEEEIQKAYYVKANVWMEETIIFSNCGIKKQKQQKGNKNKKKKPNAQNCQLYNIGLYITRNDACKTFNFVLVQSHSVFTTKSNIFIVKESTSESEFKIENTKSNQGYGMTQKLVDTTSIINLQKVIGEARLMHGIWKCDRSSERQRRLRFGYNNRRLDDDDRGKERLKLLDWGYEPHQTEKAIRELERLSKKPVCRYHAEYEGMCCKMCCGCAEGGCTQKSYNKKCTKCMRKCIWAKDQINDRAISYKIRSNLCNDIICKSRPWPQFNCVPQCIAHDNIGDSWDTQFDPSDEDAYSSKFPLGHQQLDYDVRRLGDDNKPRRAWKLFNQRMLGMGYKQHQIDTVKEGKCAGARCPTKKPSRSCGIMKCVEYELSKDKVHSIDWGGSSGVSNGRDGLLKIFLGKLKDIERNSRPSGNEVCENPGHDIMHVRCYNKNFQPRDGKNCPFPTGCTMKYYPKIDPSTKVEVWDFNGEKRPSWTQHVFPKLREWQVPPDIEQQVYKEWNMPSGAGVDFVSAATNPKKHKVRDGKSTVYYWNVEYELKIVGVVKKVDGTAQIGYFYGKGTAQIQPYFRCWKISSIMMRCGQDEPSEALIEGSRDIVEHFIVKYALNQGHREPKRRYDAVQDEYNPANGGIFLDANQQFDNESPHDNSGSGKNNDNGDGEMAIAIPPTRRRRCIFIHGVGGRNSGPATDTDTKGYWGGDEKIKLATDHLCNSYVFLHMNTVSNGWDDWRLQQQVCKAATVGNSRTISDAIVFSHSMGNLIFAGALENRVCSLSQTSDWVSLSAPWGGSNAADWVSKVCASNHRFPSILEPIATRLNYCKPNNGGVNFAYTSLTTSYPGVGSGKLRKVAEQYVSASLCGSSAFGIRSKFSLALEALATVSNYGEKNDGMVGVSSCMLRNRKYSNSYADNAKYYIAAINHADATLRTRDGGKTENSPFEWFLGLRLGGDNLKYDDFDSKRENFGAHDYEGAERKLREQALNPSTGKWKYDPVGVGSSIRDMLVNQ